MLDLPKNELILFLAVMGLYLIGAIVGYLQVIRTGPKHLPLLTHIFALAVVLEAVILVLRAAELKAVPLTGLFESMIMLTGILGLVYLILGMFLRQVWFGSMMSWLLAVLILLTALIARPVSDAQEIATEPWVLAHALAMILAAALILLAAVCGYIYLAGRARLKQKRIVKVLGMMPNLQKMERLNLWALWAAFVLITIGMISGTVGVWLKAEFLGTQPLVWLFDSKILAIFITWFLLLVVLITRHLNFIKERIVAYASLVILIWILFALVGATLFCATKHDFSGSVSTRQTSSQE